MQTFFSVPLMFLHVSSPFPSKWMGKIFFVNLFSDWFLINKTFYRDYNCYCDLNNIFQKLIKICLAIFHISSLTTVNNCKSYPCLEDWFSGLWNHEEMLHTCCHVTSGTEVRQTYKPTVRPPLFMRPVVPSIWDVRFYNKRQHDNVYPVKLFTCFTPKFHCVN